MVRFTGELNWSVTQRETTSHSNELGTSKIEGAPNFEQNEAQEGSQIIPKMKNC